MGSDTKTYAFKPAARWFTDDQLRQIVAIASIGEKDGVLPSIFEHVLAAELQTRSLEPYRVGALVDGDLASHEAWVRLLEEKANPSWVYVPVNSFVFLDSDEEILEQNK